MALDRMERVPGGREEGEGKGEGSRRSAIGRVKQEFGVPVLSIVSLDDLRGMLRARGSGEDLRRVEEYQRVYGCGD